MTDGDRDSFHSLKRVVASRRIQAVAGLIVTVIGSTYAWIEGFDKGLEAAGVDIKKLSKQVEALELRAAANETADGETLAQLVAAEARLGAMDNEKSSASKPSHAMRKTPGVPSTSTGARS